MPLDVKAAVADALLELIRRKDADKITVKDLVEVCGISRQTFYYHFKDIYDLVEWCCEEDASRALAGKKTYETWQQGLLQIFEAVQDNKPFYPQCLPLRQPRAGGKLPLQGHLRPA